MISDNCCLARNQREQCGETKPHLDSRAYVMPKETGMYLLAEFAAWAHGPNSVSALKSVEPYVFM